VKAPSRAIDHRRPEDREREARLAHEFFGHELGGPVRVFHPIRRGYRRYVDETLQVPALDLLDQVTRAVDVDVTDAAGRRWRHDRGCMNDGPGVVLRAGEFVRAGDIAVHHLYQVTRRRLERVSGKNEAADPSPASSQMRYKCATDVAGGACDEDHGELETSVPSRRMRPTERVGGCRRPVKSTSTKGL
jgi:hypothetical protein